MKLNIIQREESNEATQVKESADFLTVKEYRPIFALEKRSIIRIKVIEWYI